MVNLNIVFHKPLQILQMTCLRTQDDPLLVDYNVEERVAAFVAECEHIFNSTVGNDIMITMGADFTARPCHPPAYISWVWGLLGQAD